MSVCNVCEGTCVDPGGEVPCVPCNGSGRVTGSVHPEAKGAVQNADYVRLRLPWVRCRHRCRCLGNTASYGHEACCPRNPLHWPLHRRHTQNDGLVRRVSTGAEQL